MENKDEDALKTVENREEIRHDNRLVVDVEQAKRPSQAQQYDQNEGSFDPSSGCNHNTVHQSNELHKQDNKEKN